MAALSLVIPFFLQPMKNSINTRLAGRYFKPHSELVDGQSLGCFYAGIYRKNENGEIEYPLSVVLGEKYFSVYWHGYMLNDGVEHYGVHQLFSDDFTDQYNIPLENWLEQGKLVPLEVMQGKPYLSDTSESEIKTYRDVYTTSVVRLSENETASRTLFEHFVLDLLFDLQHSGVFRGHPAREAFMGFIQSVSKIKAIRLKAEYKYALHQLLIYRNQKGGDSKELDFLQEREEKATRAWLEFLRSSKGGAATKDSSDDRWFLGVEEEHSVVFKNSKEKHLKKQAEDSIQWLVGRYALGRAYELQFLEVFTTKNVAIIALGFCASSSAWCYFSLPFLGDSNEFHWSFHVLFVLSLIQLFIIGGLVFERLIAIFFSIGRYLFTKGKSGSPESILLSLPKIANLLRPKILLASLAVWTFLLSTNVVWNLNFRLTYPKLVVLLGLASVTFIFLSTHLTGFLAKRQKAKKVFGRIVMIGLMSIMYSFIIGTIGMALTGEKHFEEDEILSEYFNNFIVKEKINAPVYNSNSNIGNRLGEDSADENSSDNDSLTQRSSAKFAYNNEGIFLWFKDTFYDDFVGKQQYLSSFANFKTNQCDSIIAGDTTVQTNCMKSLVWRKVGALNWNRWLIDNVMDSSITHTQRERYRRVCYIRDISMGPNDRDHSLDVHHKMILVVEPLVFFTFIAVALGLMLEMGLQLQRTGVDELN